MPMPLEASKTTSLILMRHGETAWNRERRVMGNADIRLSPNGAEQSKRAAELLARFPVDRILSSPLSRARQTAEIVAGRVGLEFETDADLEEVHFGDWQGKTYREIVADPRYRGFLSDPVGTATPGGETIQDVQARGLRALQKLEPGCHALVVSHGDVIRTLISRFLAVPLREFRRIRVDNCGLTAVSIAAGHPEVKFLNVLADPDRAWDPLHWSTKT